MLNEQEMKVVGRLLVEYAKREGEDIIGLILKSGEFLNLPDDDKSVVELARKLEEAAQKGK